MGRVRLRACERPLRVADHLLAGDARRTSTRGGRPRRTCRGRASPRRARSRRPPRRGCRRCPRGRPRRARRTSSGRSAQVTISTPVGRVEREQLAGEVERHLQLAADLGEPAPLGEADALLVAELDVGEEGLVAVGGGPARELGEERRAEPAARGARCGTSGRTRGSGCHGSFTAEADRDELVLLEGEQVRPARWPPSRSGRSRSRSRRRGRARCGTRASARARRRRGSGGSRPCGYNTTEHIRGRPGFDVVGSPAELQAEVPGRPRKSTGKPSKCG